MFYDSREQKNFSLLEGYQAYGEGVIYWLMKKLNNFFLCAGQYTYQTLNGVFMVFTKRIYTTIGSFNKP